MGPENQYYGYSAPGNVQPDPNKFKRIAVVVVGIGLLFFLIIAAYLLFFTKPSIKPDIVKLAAMHQEINRVSDLGVKSNRARRSTQNSAATIRVVALDNQSRISAYIDENYNIPISKAELKSEENTDIDAILEEAAQLNEFDSKFFEVMEELLSQTNQELVRVIELSDNDELKFVLNESGTNNQQLIESLQAIE